ncbi:hypothetical protein Trco_003527 [Trichoderma cornu-damae]|uniref:Uncharacterized protein n=1 Tax=Trichoderma cornu-damae TaxID=654480 RepID=A0A9P8QL80_9HYPO|nr:hypothetical protein Trco_003527 [Trichoderma cornu-damae]
MTLLHTWAGRAVAWQPNGFCYQETCMMRRTLPTLAVPMLMLMLMLMLIQETARQDTGNGDNERARHFVY